MLQLSEHACRGAQAGKLNVAPALPERQRRFCCLERHGRLAGAAGSRGLAVRTPTSTRAPVRAPHQAEVLSSGPLHLLLLPGAVPARPPTQQSLRVMASFESKQGQCCATHCAAASAPLRRPRQT